ncbi:MAG: metallophosphoesterase family protein [bacterium]
MDEDLRDLYRELGYTGPLPESGRRTPGGVDGGEDDGGYEAPPLDSETLSALEKSLKDNSANTLADLRAEISYPLSDDEIMHTISEARKAFDDPASFLDRLRKQKQEDGRTDRQTRGIFDRAYHVPEELKQYPDIEIDPGNHKFEPRADALGWVFNAGGFWMREKLKIKTPKAPFPSHDDSPGHFVYEMKDRNNHLLDEDQKITIALFSDFGTGVYHSRFIAKKITELQPDYAFHLGDVYYAGRKSEFENYFKEPLDPLLQTTRYFALNANHEMHSGAFPYFDYLKYKRSISGVGQEQEGSYFCVRNGRYQFIGIDTAYHENGRHRDKKLQDWLGARLREGKDGNRTNVLLSPNQPYTLGEDKFSDLYEDLNEFINNELIDYWFWGNTHYCSVFEPSSTTPFVGVCVGHGGHPIYKKDIEDKAEKHANLRRQNKPVAPVAWTELSPRFPEETELRQEMGNHGYCILVLERESLKMTFYDWLGEKRYEWGNG